MYVESKPLPKYPSLLGVVIDLSLFLGVSEGLTFPASQKEKIKKNL